MRTTKDDEDDARAFLEDYDTSAIDDLGSAFSGPTENDARGRAAESELERTPEARADMIRSTPVGPTVHHRADGTTERTEPEPRTVALDMEPMAIAPDVDYEAEYPVERAEDSVLRSDQMQGADTPEGWASDEQGALYAMGGLGFDYDATPTATQGMDDASATTRNRGTSLEGRGARVPGTLDMSRPAVQMPDGSTATVRSASFGTDEGEVLLPTISPGGADWSDEEAFDAYRNGGGHLGIYDSPEAATAAAEGIHQDEAGYPADDDESAEAAMGIDDDESLEEGPNAETYGMASDEDPELPAAAGAAMPSVNDESGFWGMATDDDPELPGRVNTDAADVEAAMGIDDETAEMGGMELASPAAPRATAKTPDAGDPAMRLDAGLPSEAEIGGATALDALRFPLHAIGAGFSAAAGRSSSPFRSIAGPMREARSEGIEGRLGAKAETAASDREAAVEDRRSAEERASAERLASIRREPTDLERQREANRAAEAERSAGLRSRGLDLTERELAGSESEAAMTASERAAQTDPTSPASEAARRRLRVQLNALASSPRTAPIAEALGADLDSMSAADIERLERSPLLRPLTGRGGGVAGGGGGTRDALAAQWVAAGFAPDEETAAAEIAAIGPRNARTRLAPALGSTGAEGATELIPGVHATVGDMTAPQITAWRSGWRSVRSRMDALREIEGIANSEGMGAVIDPSVAARLEPYMMTLRGMAADAQGTGVINPSEMPAINAALPDATSLSGMSLGRFRGALREWRNLVETGIRHSLEDYGVSDEETRSAMGALRSGERTRRAPDRRGASSSGPTVRVRDADGRVSSVPAEAWAELPEEERAGYEVVE